MIIVTGENNSKVYQRCDICNSALQLDLKNADYWCTQKPEAT